MNPTPAAITKILAAVNATAAKWTVDNATVLANVTATTVANPQPQGTIPTPMTWARLKAALTDTELAAVGAHTAFNATRDEIRSGDRAGFLECLDIFRAAAVIATAKVTALTTAINSGTIPDPSYRATVPQIEIDLGRPADLDDIRAARAAGGF